MRIGNFLCFVLLLTLNVSVTLNAAENSVWERSVKDAEGEFSKSAVDRFEQMFQSGDFDFKTYGYRGVTVLHYAVFMNDLERVKLLIEKGADVNIQNGDGNTAIFYAALNSNLEIVQYLIENGADITITNKSRKDFIHYAARSGNLELVQWLVNQGISVSEYNGALHNAVASGNLELVKWLVAHGADVNSYFLNDSVLAYAIECSNMDIMRYLVEQEGVDVNASTHKRIYYPALEEAVKHNNFESVKFLVEHGANINPPYIFGKYPTPGWYYLSNTDPKIVQYLRERDTVLKGLSIAVSLIVLAAISAFIYFIYRMTRPRKPAEIK